MMIFTWSAKMTHTKYIRKLSMFGEIINAIICLEVCINYLKQHNELQMQIATHMLRDFEL